MKIKRKKPFVIGEMPEILKTAHIKNPVLKKSKGSVSPDRIDRIAHDYENNREEAAAVNKGLDEYKNSIKALAEQSGEKDGKFVILKGAKYVIGYVLADQEPKIADIIKCSNVIGRKICEEISEIVINRKKLEEYVNKGLVTPAQLKKILIPQPPQKRIHVRRIK